MVASLVCWSFGTLARWLFYLLQQPLLRQVLSDSSEGRTRTAARFWLVQVLESSLGGSNLFVIFITLDLWGSLVLVLLMNMNRSMDFRKITGLSKLILIIVTKQIYEARALPGLRVQSLTTIHRPQQTKVSQPYSFQYINDHGGMMKSYVPLHPPWYGVVFTAPPSGMQRSSSWIRSYEGERSSIEQRPSEKGATSGLDPVSVYYSPGRSHK
jgi:hypothetical protein